MNTQSMLYMKHEKLMLNAQDVAGELGIEYRNFLTQIETQGYTVFMFKQGRKWVTTVPKFAAYIDELSKKSA